MMNEKEIERYKKEIDGMDREEMARVWRFSPSGHPIFNIEHPLFDYFKKRFDSLGGFNPAISKKIGWEKFKPGYYRVIFSNIPDAPSGNTQFIELEDYAGRGVAGEWKELENGTVALIIPMHPAMSIASQALKMALASLIHVTTESQKQYADLELTRSVIRSAISRIKESEGNNNAEK
jgi:hypothetical protein